MQLFGNISIRRKVMLLVLLASLLALTLTVLALLAYEFAAFREHALRNALDQSHVVSVAVRPALDFNQDETATQILATLRDNRQIAAGCIYRKNGQIFARYTRSNDSKFPFPSAQPDGQSFEKNSLLIFQTIYSGGESVGKLFLRFDLESPWAALPQYAAIIGGIALVLLVLALVSTALLQRIISTPLSRLAQSARLVSEQKDFSIRVEKQSEDEIGQLTETFNQMLATIESRDRSLREVNEQLQAREKELARYNSELEQRVDERTASLRETIAYLEGFCYSIAHDLRAPLRSMAGFATIVLEDHSAQLDDDGKRHVQRILDSAKHMDQLMMDLLAFGKLSQIELSFSAINLSREVEIVVAGLTETIRAANAEVIVQPKMPAVWANETVLEQTLTNLISNALKFTRPEVRPRIEISSFAKGDRIRICIEDNGIGIAPEHQERVFRVFERLHPERRYSGTGIGLAIVKRGIERMKGRVGVQSTPGEGSRFWVELPSAVSVRT